FEIELEWEVANQYVLEPIRVAAKRELAICPAKGSSIFRCRPLEKNPSLYAEFASLDGSKRSCLRFAHKYGLLSTRPSYQIREVETLKIWRDQIKVVRDIIRRCELSRADTAEAFRQFGKRDTQVGAVDIYLSIKGSKSPIFMEVRALSLIHAIQLQAAQSILEGKRSFQCIECSRPFAIGSGARRSHSKF